MNAIDWLARNAPGFAALPEQDRDAITYFLFLWSLFEATALSTRGNARAIIGSANRWAEAGLLTPDTFQENLIYLQDRYYANGNFTYHFDHLHLRPVDKPDLVRKVLRDDRVEPNEIAAALLII